MRLGVIEYPNLGIDFLYQGINRLNSTGIQDWNQHVRDDLERIRRRAGSDRRHDLGLHINPVEDLLFDMNIGVSRHKIVKQSLERFASIHLVLLMPHDQLHLFSSPGFFPWHSGHCQKDQNHNE